MKKIVAAVLTILLTLTFLPQINAEAPNEIQKEIIYDIFIDRLNNGTLKHSEQVDIHDPLKYKGGDIKGIIMKLDEIVEHGFTTISLSPVMKNIDQGYHGYWIEDFFDLEEQFGSKEDFEKLIAEAHDRRLKVIIEFVPNYIAKDSELAKDKSKQHWFKDVEVDPIPSTEWLNNVLMFNHEEAEVREYLIDAAKYWMKTYEIDGFKLHAADQTDESFLKELSGEIKAENPGFYVMAASLQGDSLEHLCPIESIDAFANEEMFALLNKVFTQVDQPVLQLYEAWEKMDCERNLLFVDNINTARFSNNVGDEGRNAATTWNLLLHYLYFSPGTPLVYQGSEVPMYGPGFPENQYFVDFVSADPDMKKLFEKMAAAREQFEPLVYGAFEHVTTTSGLSLFKRTYENETVFFAINNDSHSNKVKISGIDTDMQLRGLFLDDTIRPDENGDFTISIPRESADLIIIQPNIGFNWTFIGSVVGVMVIFVGGIVFLSIKQRRREKAINNK